MNAERRIAIEDFGSPHWRNVSLALANRSPAWIVALGLIVLGQVVIAFPIVGALTIAATEAVPRRMLQQIEALGPTAMQAARLHAREAHRGIAVAVLAGFGHALSEVGAAMMLGGNLAGSTRVLTTATVLAARMGQYDLAIGLAVLLFALALFVNGAAVALSGRADHP